jgi:hypothetical protein
LLDTPIITARCEPSDDGSLLIIQPVDRAGAQAFLATLDKCAMMRLTLFDESGAFVKMPIPNDDQYRRASRSFFSKIARE